MATFIVCCQATIPELLQGVEIVLSTYGDHVQITENLWAVVTDREPKFLRDELKNLVESQGSDGRVFIVQSGRTAAWSKSICPNKWLLDNL